MVFPVCPSDGSTCTIHIAYNIQMPLCDGSDTNCRDSSNLCVADNAFHFNLTNSTSNDVIIYSLFIPSYVLLYSYLTILLVIVLNI